MYQASPFLRAVYRAVLRAVGYILFLLLLTSAIAVVPAEQSHAVEWAPAVRFPLTANTLALSNANVATVSGAASMSANPAGLGHIHFTEAQATRLNPMLDVSLEAVAIAFPASWGGWGLSAQQLSSVDMVKTDSEGNAIGVFAYHENAVAISGAKNIGGTNLGVALRGVWQELDYTMKTGYEVLAGIQQQITPSWHAGVVASHVWQPPADDELPGHDLRLQAGVSYSTNAISLHGSVLHGSVGRGHNAVAVAYRPLRGLELRAARECANGEAVYRLGLGVAGQRAAIDYAYLTGGNSELPEQLPLGHVVSVRFTF